MDILRAIVSGALLGVGLVGLLSRPTAEYRAREGMRAWHLYSALFVTAGTVGLLLKTWWPVPLLAASMWLIHNTLGPWLAQHGIPRSAVDHVRALGVVYFQYQGALPGASQAELLRLIVAGSPEFGLRGRYDEVGEELIREGLYSGIESGGISNLLRFMLATLEIEGKLNSNELAPAMTQRWNQMIIRELQAIGVPTEEIVGRGEAPDRNKKSPRKPVPAGTSTKLRRTAQEEAHAEIHGRMDQLVGLDRRVAFRLLTAAEEIITKILLFPGLELKEDRMSSSAFLQVYKIILSQLAFTLFAKDEPVRSSLSKLISVVTDLQETTTNELWWEFERCFELESEGNDVRLTTAELAGQKVIHILGGREDGANPATLCFARPWEDAARDLRSDPR